MVQGMDIEGAPGSSGEDGGKFDFLNVCVNGVPVARISDNMQFGSSALLDSGSVGIPVKAGTRVTIEGNLGAPLFDNKTMSDDASVTFKEFQLSAALGIGSADLKALIAAISRIGVPSPDYNNKMPVGSGFRAATNGFVMMTTKSAPKNGYRYAFINNVRVFIPLSEKATEFDCVHYGIYPVVTGDVVTLPNDAEDYITLFWVPAK